jgi:ATP-dependent RNA helicase DeaD
MSIPTYSTFNDLPISPSLQGVLTSLEFITPTEIQAKAIPLLLGSEKIDFHGQAQTGTGKTLAFGLPLLHRINIQSNKTQALIVAPTRELAQQIGESLAPFARAMNISTEVIYGGASIVHQMNRLSRGIQIIIGTPGRLHDHLKRKTLSLSTIRTLVLDEADIMLDMGFKEEIDELLTHMPDEREIWLFSATVKDGISQIMRSHMHNTQTVKIRKKSDAESTSATAQYYCMVPMRSRIHALCHFIESIPDFYGFIFCQTKILAAEVAEQLLKRGYNAGSLHGDMGQAQRNTMIKKFRHREITVLAATDVAARGIDVADLTHVVNFSLPEDVESYIHRIGRTGRAGKSGTAITFINKGDMRALSFVAKKFNVEINPITVPCQQDIITAKLAKAQHYITNIADQGTDLIDQHVTTLIASLPAETIQKCVHQLVRERFLNNILPDESFAQAPDMRSAMSNSTPGAQELMFSVGREDELDEATISQTILDTKVITSEQIYKIRMIKRLTFIEVPENKASELIAALKSVKLASRALNPRCVTNGEVPRENNGGGRFERRRPSYNDQRGGGDWGDRNGGGRRNSRGGGEYYGATRSSENSYGKKRFESSRGRNNGASAWESK